MIGARFCIYLLQALIVLIMFGLDLLGAQGSIITLTIFGLIHLENILLEMYKDEL